MQSLFAFGSKSIKLERSFALERFRHDENIYLIFLVSKSNFLRMQSLVFCFLKVGSTPGMEHSESEYPEFFYSVLSPQQV